MNELSPPATAILLSRELDEAPQDDDVPDDPQLARLLDDALRTPQADHLAEQIEVLLGAGALLDRPERRSAMNTAADRALKVIAEQAQTGLDLTEPESEPQYPPHE